jgi:hypothetical protein
MLGQGLKYLKNGRPSNFGSREYFQKLKSIGFKAKFNMSNLYDDL